MSNITNSRVTVVSPKVNGSNIPLRKPLVRQTSSPIAMSRIPINNLEAHKWKQKYDEVEQRRKILLTEKEKVLRYANDLEKKFVDLQIKHEHLETELFEKNEEYTKLSTASKNLYKEYETLKNQYETETGAMSKALKDASHWYQENKVLKRKTLHLQDRDSVDEGVDAGESATDSDLENLNKTIKQLSTEVAELQTEVDSLKHSEFQILEQNTKLSEDLEHERRKNKEILHELVDLRQEHGHLLRVSDMMKKELQELKEIEETQRNDVVNLRRTADGYKKERNVLAHQSTVLLQGLGDSNDMVLVQEMEDLKRTLEEERNRHDEEIRLLQEKIEDQENNSHLEVLEERLKLTETELNLALERAEKAEEALKAPPTPPPPPPPPAPPVLPGEPPVVPLRVKRRSRVNVLDLAEAIGVQEHTEKKPAAGVNEDIINAIKEGKFTLKKAKNDSKKDKETPKAVSEILNILGSLRRAPKKRQSQFIGDVQL